MLVESSSGSDGGACGGDGGGGGGGGVLASVFWVGLCLLTHKAVQLLETYKNCVWYLRKHKNTKREQKNKLRI